MVRIIGQLLLSGGGTGEGRGRDGESGDNHPQAPSLCLILGPRQYLESENFSLTNAPRMWHS